jgi:hypothetical protein
MSWAFSSVPPASRYEAGRRAGQVFADDLAPGKTEYSICEDLATAGSGVFYFTKTLKNLP